MQWSNIAKLRAPRWLQEDPRLLGKVEQLPPGVCFAGVLLLDSSLFGYHNRQCPRLMNWSFGRIPVLCFWFQGWSVELPGVKVRVVCAWQAGPDMI